MRTCCTWIEQKTDKIYEIIIQLETAQIKRHNKTNMDKLNKRALDEDEERRDDKRFKSNVDNDVSDNGGDSGQVVQTSDRTNECTPPHKVTDTAQLSMDKLLTLLRTEIAESSKLVNKKLDGLAKAITQL